MTEYKRAPCVHGNPCRESMCVEYGRSEAAAGPRDEELREALHEGVELALTLSTDPVGRRERVHAAIDAALAKASES